MKTTGMNYTPIQLKLPVDLENIIEINDAVYAFNEVVSHIDLKKYFVEKDYKATGRPRYEREKLLKVLLFAFMEQGYPSLREIEKLCKVDIRFIWLLDEMKAPSYATLCDFINQELSCSLDEIVQEINNYIFAQEHVDLDHVYIDGTKIEASANKYSWVWKKSCLTSISREFDKITKTFQDANETVLQYLGLKLGVREEYTAEYLSEILEEFLKVTGMNQEEFAHGSGRRKTAGQRLYERIDDSRKKLKGYREKVDICGDKRNSYSKTDHDATFMRVKKDYMGNDQLLPAYNVQMGICDGYIAVYGVYQYASDSDCFQPLIEEFKRRYHKYPKYPVADAGYGNLNNYLYCQEHGMEKYMKFPMYEKETKGKKYHDDPYRAVNFRVNEAGRLVCPNGKEFLFLRTEPVKGNQYGRTVELHQCEDCSGCPHRSKCHKSRFDRIIRLNYELTSFHKEVLDNLNSIHGALLRMNRSIQSEGTYGEIKANRGYERFRRRGINKVILEIALISCGFNLHKYHLSKLAKANPAKAAG